MGVRAGAQAKTTGKDRGHPKGRRELAKEERGVTDTGVVERREQLVDFIGAFD